MKPSIVSYFEMQRRIFGLCPKCNQLFRLSDCKIYSGTKPIEDWMDELTSASESLDAREEKLQMQANELREAAREEGRLQADKAVRKVDTIFKPKNMNPDDAKVIFDPIDFAVFDGMKATGSVRRIVLLDRQTNDLEQKSLQSSIEKTIEKGNYEWQTLLAKEDGTIDRI